MEETFAISILAGFVRICVHISSQTGVSHVHELYLGCNVIDLSATFCAIESPYWARLIVCMHTPSSLAKLS
jgi:hypothetical protein